jgi:zinc transporter ZupT
VRARVATPGTIAGRRAVALLPVVVLAVVVGLFVARGSSVIDLVGRGAPPADAFDVRRVTFHPGEIRIQVRNPQPQDLTIAVVTVDDAIVPHTVEGDATLGRLRSATIVVPYHWVEDEPVTVGVTSSTGIQTTEVIAAAVETPAASARSVVGYGLIGFLVGVVPIAIGLLWLPSLRRARDHWRAAFMALTAGLLTFLGLEALAEAFELQATLPPAFGGPGLVLLGVAGSALGMLLLGERLARGATAGGALALLVAVGIGLHNLGEGLAIGASFAVGALQLGTFLIVGFMLHNVTEGLGIAAAGSDERISTGRIATLALVAGAPAIAGAWIGGYATNDVLGVLFLAVAAGAALQVVLEVGRDVARRAPGGLRSPWAIGGFLAGIAVMQATGLLLS